MGRSRSRSPRREKKRKSKERERDKERRGRRKSHSKSPHSRRSPRHRHSPRGRGRSGSSDEDEVIFTGVSHISELPPKPSRKNKNKKTNEDNELPNGVSPAEQEMMKLMGFATFDTTKGKKVNGTDISSVNLVQKRKYRQYMNRRGGFNRPLDFVA